MFTHLFQKLQERGDFQQVFYAAQILIGGVFVGLLWLFKPKTPESGFRVREADLKKNANPKAHSKNSLAEAKIQRPSPLRLEGIRLDGQPHEILGVPPDATPSQIQKAYRELMKRYHPDRIAPLNSQTTSPHPGIPSSQWGKEEKEKWPEKWPEKWKDAQKIAEAINQAKDTLLKKNQTKRDT